MAKLRVGPNLLLACLVLVLVLIAALSTAYSFWFSIIGVPTPGLISSAPPGEEGPLVREVMRISPSESFSIAGQMAALWLPQLLATVQAVFSKRDRGHIFSLSQLAVAVLVCILYSVLLSGSGWIFYLQAEWLFQQKLPPDRYKLLFFEHLRSFQGFLIPVSAVVTTLLASLIEASKSVDEKKPDAKKLRSRRLMSQIRRRR